MIRGTTPTHTFKVPFDASVMGKVQITYSQNDVVLFQKHTSDCVVIDGSVTTKLTQGETLLFDHRKNVEIQIRILTPTGDALASKVFAETVGRCLDNEVLK